MRKALKPDEAARFLRVKKGTLAQWRSRGRGPKFVRVSGTVRYMEDDLENYLSANTRQSTKDTIKL